MAVYNGENYLRQQLDSILAQTEQNRILYVRDDGSTDSSPEIIREYALKHPGMVIPVRDSLGALGCVQNFMTLLKAARSDYYMFCDQDDIWKADKVEKTLSAMQKAEREAGGVFHCGTPVCVHTDLEVIDGDGNPVHPSFVEKLGLDAQRATFAGLIYSNAVTGCTMMINQAMKEMLAQVPESCMMHDQWIALLAEGCGRRVFLPETTICYRQHTDNVMGAKGRTSGDKLKKMLNIGGYLKGIERTRELRERQYRQLEDFYRLHKDRLTPEAGKAAADLLNIKHLSGKQREKLLEEGGYLPKDSYEATTMKLYYRWWVK